MKIPTQPLPTVNQAPLARPGLSTSVGQGNYLAKGLDALARGVSEAGRAAQQAEKAVVDTAEAKRRREEQIAAQAQREADAAATAELEAKAMDRGISRNNGDDDGNARTFDVIMAPNGGGPSFTETSLKGPRSFLRTQGADASAGYADTIAAHEKDREELAASASNERVRQMFLTRTTRLYAGLRRQVENHVTTQNEVAKKAAAQDSQKAALRKLALDPMAPDVQDTINLAEGPTAALAVPGSEAEKVAEFRGLATATRLKSLLAKKDWASAEQVFKESGETLAPPVRAVAEKQIAQVKAGAQAYDIASRAVAASRTEDGQVDVERAVAAANALAQKLPDAGDVDQTGDTDLAKAARRQALTEARLANAQWKADTEKVKRNAAAAFGKRERFDDIPVDLVEELRKRDWPLYDRLLHHEERLAQARAFRLRAGDAAADREQERINRDALREYNTHSPEARTKLDVEATFAGTGVNKSGLDLIKGHQVTDVERLKTHGERETAFVNEVLNDARAQRQVSGKARDVNTAVLRSLATEKFKNWVDGNKGALPSNKDAELMRNEVLRIQQVPGSIYGTNPKPQWKIDAEAKAKQSKEPAPKKVRSYRYSKDRTSRKPVFEDGSEGPPEQVK